MKINKWTSGLAAVGLVILAPGARAQDTNAPAAASTNAPASAPAPIPLATALTATTISGYVDTSMVWNPGTGNANPAPYLFNAGKQDGFNIDSADVKIARAPDSTPWGAGYTLEVMYGPDGAAIAGDVPLRQAYVELMAPVGNGIDFEVGQFDNIIGYEANDDYKNPNWTRSYGYTLEPTSHTGVEGTYKFTDEVSWELGVVNSITSTGNARNTSGAGGATIESKKAIISLLSLTAPTNWGSIGGSALYFGFDFGPGNASEIGGTHHVDKDHLYIGATINTPVTGLTLGLAWDTVNNSDAGASGIEGYASSLALYSSYKVPSTKITLNGRAEYVHGSAFDSFFAEAAVPKEEEAKVFALTGTLQYDLWANVISRLEARWDTSADGSPHFGGTIPGLATKNNDVVLAANLIYKF
jgi:hypothetical protein